jgi:hypothetical protein
MPEKIRKAYRLTPVKRQKYGAKREGGYASQREAKRGWELEQLQAAGKITALQKQVSYGLLPACAGYPRPLRYVADFCFIEDGKVIVEDAKGFATPVYRLKKRLMAQLLGIEIREV